MAFLEADGAIHEAERRVSSVRFNARRERGHSFLQVTIDNELVGSATAGNLGTSTQIVAKVMADLFEMGYCKEGINKAKKRFVVASKSAPACGGH